LLIVEFGVAGDGEGEEREGVHLLFSRDAKMA